MDQELHHELRPHGVEHYRREAKAVLRAARAGDADARSRAEEALGDRARERFVFADALHVVAVEHGFRSWPAFKRDCERRADGAVRPVGRIGAFPASRYAESADALLDAARRGEGDAIARMRGRVPRLQDAGGDAIARTATTADARICLALEYGMRTWAELAAAADRACETHYSRLPPESPWKRAEGAIHAGDARELQRLLDAHPALEHEDPGMTLLAATAQPEAGRVPREVVDVLVTAGSELDVPLNLAACFDKADLVAGCWMGRAASTEIWGITPLQTAVYHGARAAADVLVARTGLLPDAFYIAAAAGDVARLEAWSTPAGACARRRCASGPTSPTSAGRRARRCATTPTTCSPRRWRSPPTSAAPAPARRCWTAAPIPPAPRCTGSRRCTSPRRWGAARRSRCSSGGALRWTPVTACTTGRRWGGRSATGSATPRRSRCSAPSRERRDPRRVAVPRWWRVDRGHRRALVCRGEVRLGGGRLHVHRLPPSPSVPTKVGTRAGRVCAAHHRAAQVHGSGVQTAAKRPPLL